MGDSSYDKVRDKLFSTLSSALEEIDRPSEPTPSDPPEGERGVAAPPRSPNARGQTQAPSQAQRSDPHTNQYFPRDAPTSEISDVFDQESHNLQNSLQDLQKRVDRVDAKLSELEASISEVSTLLSSTSSADQYVLDVLDRIQHVQTMVADVYKKTADLPSLKEELADLKSAVELLRADIKGVLSDVRVVKEATQQGTKLRVKNKSISEKWKDLV